MKELSNYGIVEVLTLELCVIEINSGFLVKRGDTSPDTITDKLGGSGQTRPCLEEIKCLDEALFYPPISADVLCVLAPFTPAEADLYRWG